MAAPLTWRNVDAPDFRGVTDALRFSNDAMTRAFTGLNAGIDKFRERRTEEVDNAALTAALRFRDGASYREALANGSALNGIDTTELSSRAIAMLGSRAGELLNQDRTQQEVAFNREANPIQIRNLGLTGEQLAQNIAQKRELHPLEVEQARLRNQGSVLSNRNQEQSYNQRESLFPIELATAGVRLDGSRIENVNRQLSGVKLIDELQANRMSRGDAERIAAVASQIDGLPAHEQRAAISQAGLSPTQQNGLLAHLRSIKQDPYSTEAMNNAPEGGPVVPNRSSVVPAARVQLTAPELIANAGLGLGAVGAVTSAPSTGGRLAPREIAQQANLAVMEANNNPNLTAAQRAERMAEISAWRAQATNGMPVGSPMRANDGVAGYGRGLPAPTGNVAVIGERGTVPSVPSGSTPGTVTAPSNTPAATSPVVAQALSAEEVRLGLQRTTPDYDLRNRQIERSLAQERRGVVANYDELQKSEATVDAVVAGLQEKGALNGMSRNEMNERIQGIINRARATTGANVPTPAAAAQILADNTTGRQAAYFTRSGMLGLDLNSERWTPEVNETGVSTALADFTTNRTAGQADSYRNNRNIQSRLTSSREAMTKAAEEYQRIRKLSDSDPRFRGDVLTRAQAAYLAAQSRYAAAYEESKVLEPSYAPNADSNGRVSSGPPPVARTVEGRPQNPFNVAFERAFNR